MTPQLKNSNVVYPSSNAARKSEKGSIIAKLLSACARDWAIYVHHPFVQQLADGSLPSKCFQYYLVQLYLFSKHYSRAFALAVVKSEHLDDLREAAAHVDLQLNYEMALHVDYCRLAPSIFGRNSH